MEITFVRQPAKAPHNKINRITIDFVSSDEFLDLKQAQKLKDYILKYDPAGN